MTGTSRRLGQPDLSASVPGRTVEKVSRQYSRWLEGLSPFFFLARGKALRPLGRYSRNDCEWIPRDYPFDPWVQPGERCRCWVVGRLPFLPRSHPPFPNGDHRRNLPLSLISGPRGTSPTSLFFKNSPRFPARRQGARDSPYDLGYYALVIGSAGKSGEHEWTSVTRRITYFDVERRN